MLTDKADKYEAIKEAFEQFSHIAQVRNALVHWTGRMDGGDVFVASNKHKKHIIGEAQEWRISLPQLGNYIRDKARLI